jgi:putative transposase
MCSFNLTLRWEMIISGHMKPVRSRRPRKRHVQQELFRHGGKRKGAGRKATKARAGSSHARRDTIKRYHALHVVMRVVPEVGSMRRRKMYNAVRDASITAALRERFRIVHLSIQRTHIHMLAEAENERALARGLQGFQISVARNVNTILGADKYRRRRGKVFADRYHVEVITTPRRARHALSYVQVNRSIHGEAARWTDCACRGATTQITESPGSMDQACAQEVAVAWGRFR